MFMKIYQWPQKNMMIAVPGILILSFIVGLLVDTSFLMPTIMLATIIMIYATMVGLKLGELTKIKEDSRLIGASFAINFLFIPGVAFLLGILFFSDQPLMFAGLALAALLPTSGMTISWTGIQKGNVPAAVKLTVFGLIAGALLTPWYLLAMIGQFVPIHVMAILHTILMVVFIPLVLGQLTTFILLKKYSQPEFQKKIKPNFPPLSVWGLLWVVFVSTSVRADMIVANIGIIGSALAAVLLFYLINFAFSTWVAKRFFHREQGIALVNGTALRNLSIALGIAATSFGGEAALLLTLAFLIQYQMITYYAKFSMTRWFQPEGKAA
ncbi:arsenic resistance protein [Alkalicoccus chagannorensis]|uniref:arsenic resistance protein n=1 Tax=Alkalicoccus chagannorensis TaxID=427072 RepID=UPI0004204E45|nr:bile acid:sodium symporter [Alkalicoccus chagannorensis]